MKKKENPNNVKTVMPINSVKKNPNPNKEEIPRKNRKKKPNRWKEGIPGHNRKKASSGINSGFFYISCFLRPAGGVLIIFYLYFFYF